MVIKNYINLTNGIEAIPKLKKEGMAYSFIRIQSSQCEAKNWLKVLNGLDTDLLMNCALGNICRVYDFSQKKESSRALYQGLTLVKYILDRRWYGIEPDQIYIKENADAKEYYDSIYNIIFKWDQNKEKNDLKKKIDYFKKFLKGKSVNLIGIPGSTHFDGDYKYYKELLHEAHI